MTIEKVIEREKLEAIANCDMATAYHADTKIFYSEEEEAYRKIEEMHRAKAEYHGQIAEWLKDYKRLLEQEPILDKIRAKIMQLDYDLESIDYDYDDMPCTEEVHLICREEVLKIIDKYKAESEGKNVR